MCESFYTHHEFISQIDEKVNENQNFSEICNSLHDIAPDMPATLKNVEVTAKQSSQENRRRINWRDNAACSDIDTNLFFPSGDGKQAQVQIEKAKEICGKCAVKNECLEFALETRQEVGIWGGNTEGERRKLLKIPRNRKND